MRSPRYVTLVTGPPCSGHGDWVAERAKDGDLVVSYEALLDQVRRASPRLHLHDQRNMARDRYDQLIGMVPDFPARAWVISSVPDPTERGELAARIRADRVVVLLPTRDVCLNRASLDNADRQTYARIRRWFGQYAPSHDDQVITPAGVPAW